MKNRMSNRRANKKYEFVLTLSSKLKNAGIHLLCSFSCLNTGNEEGLDQKVAD